MKKIDFYQLKKFLYNANKKGYAGDSIDINPQKPGFEETEYKEGDYLFHDSYIGHYFAPGQEVIYYKKEPIWAMAYAGGMKFKYHGNGEFTHETIIFLKKALLAMDPEKPYRGPKKFKEGDWRYESELTGNIKDFIGNEKIYHKSVLVFEQNFIGGVVVQ